MKRTTVDDEETTITDFVGSFVYEEQAEIRSLKYLITPAGRWNADI